MIEYRPEIDGLRAVAVVPVVLFHLGLGWVAGGYLGVDVFFVISGFLITQIIVHELKNGTFSYKHFISRRIRRIAPVLIAVVLVTLAVTSQAGFAYDFAFVAEQSLSSLLFTANHYFWNNIGNYWGPTAEESVLLHTWSLSLEEQFYFIFPWILVLLWKLGRRMLISSLVLLMAASAVFFLYSTLFYPQAAFYLLPSRAWELLAGSLLAMFTRDRGEERPRVATENAMVGARVGWNMQKRASGIGLVLILLAYLSNFDQSTLNANRFAAVIGCLLILAYPGNGLVFKLLASKCSIWIGKRSYSVYMWHWPIIVWSKDTQSFGSLIVVGGVILLASTCSYYLIEQSTRRRDGVVPWILGAFVFACCLSFGLLWYGTVPDATENSFESPVWHGSRFNLMPREESSAWDRQLQAANVTIPEFEKQADAFVRGGLIYGTKETPQIVVLGDSHAAMWSNELMKYAERTNRTISLWSLHGVDPFIRMPISEGAATGDLTSSEKLEYDKARLKLVELWQPDVVVLAVRWPLWGTKNASDLLRFLERNAGHVLVVGPVPESDIGDRIVVHHLRLRGIKPRTSQPLYMKMKNFEQMRTLQAELDDLASRFTNVTVVPMFDIYSRGGNVLVLLGNQTVYLDDDHLTEFGAQMGIGRLANTIEAMLKKLQSESPLHGVSAAETKN